MMVKSQLITQAEEQDMDLLLGEFKVEKQHICLVCHLGDGLITSCR